MPRFTSGQLEPAAQGIPPRELGSGFTPALPVANLRPEQNISLNVWQMLSRQEFGDADMVDQDLRTTYPLPHRPVHSLFIPIPMVCFLGTLATDLAYWGTAEMMWANASAWLLTVGLLFGLLAVIALIVDALGRRLSSMRGPVWLYMICNALILVLSFFNALVHSRDAWTSVVPTGLILSSVVVVLVLFSSWIRRSRIYRRGSGAER